jgi:putative ABC transport system ATP-binding protein
VGQPVPVIELEEVHKVYRSGPAAVAALRGVSLRVEAGEFVAVVGSSGSGKSTLMNVLGCLDTPTAGRYCFDGRDVGRLGRAARAALRNERLGFVFQGFHLLPRQTALENVQLPLLYAGLPAGKRRARALELLDLVGLTDRAGHRPSQLSGGQQQRVAIARALANDPQVLLADEPTGNLDSRTGEEVLAHLRRLHGRRGQTILLVTHDHAVAASADRVVTVRDGRIHSDERRALPAAGELAAKCPAPS